MPAKRRGSSKKRTSSKDPPLPKGFGTVTPYLTVRGADDALAFYQKAFGARRLVWRRTPDGRLLHGRIRIGNSIVMISEDFASEGATPESRVGLHIYTREVDKLWARAVAAGAKIDMPLDDAFWGERYGQLSDPFGHSWSISRPIRMSRAQREEKQRAAMAMFAQMAEGGAPPSAP